MVYYNENDRNTAAWLRELIDMGLVAEGEVDERSIVDVEPADLKDYTQCHFFAGIGVWSYALRLAGVSDDTPVWTGSCPCQPFSAAGQQKGTQDERHLWPVWYRLIVACQPSVVYGEQVASSEVIGTVKRDPARTVWLDTVLDDLADAHYATGAQVAPACSVGAPHIRQRCWLVAQRLAYNNDTRSQGRSQSGNGTGERVTRQGGVVVRVGNPRIESGERDTGELPEAQTEAAGSGCVDGRYDHGHPDAGEVSRVADNKGDRRSEGNTNETRGLERNREDRSPRARDGLSDNGADPTTDLWRDSDWLYCRDGKWRPIKPGVSKMVNGITCRMGCSCYTSTSQTEYEEVDDPVQTMPETPDAETIQQRSAGVPVNVEAEEVLRQGLHGTKPAKSNKEGEFQKQSEAIREKGFKKLRSLQKQEELTCPPQGRKPSKQFAGKFTDLVREMPQGGTLAELFCSGGQAYMQTLRQASNEKRPLLDTQHSLSEIWESLNDQDKDRVELHFAQGDFKRTRTIGVSPLVNGSATGVGRSSRESFPEIENTNEARAMRLKGYGNAIVAPQAAAFIKATLLEIDDD